MGLVGVLILDCRITITVNFCRNYLLMKKTAINRLLYFILFMIDQILNVNLFEVVN